MKKEKNVEEELSVSEADGNEIKWQEAEISHAKKESKGPSHGRGRTGQE